MTPERLSALVDDYATDALARMRDVLTARGITLADLDPDERAQLYAAATLWVVWRRGDPTARPN
jgi:hypothetical protein